MRCNFALRANNPAMRELFTGIFTWGSHYAGMPWRLNGYAVKLENETVLIDPPMPEEADLPRFDAFEQVARIVLTNRDHTRAAEWIRERYAAPIAAFADEVLGFAPMRIDETFSDGDR